MRLPSELLSRTVIRVFISIQHAVGSADQRRRKLVGCRTLCISDAERQRVRELVRCRFFFEHIPNCFYKRFRFRYMLGFGDYDKFVSAPSCDKAVIYPSDVLKCFRNDFDRVVAFQMPVGVVDVLESVYIGDKKVERTKRGNRRKLVQKPLVGEPPVV